MKTTVKIYIKKSETVVVSDFSAPISKSVRIVGCGGRTRTYDLRVMSGDILNFFNLKSRVYLRIIENNRTYLSSNKIHFPQI